MLQPRGWDRSHTAWFPTLSLLTVGLPMIGVKPNQVFIIKAIIFLIVVLITCRKKNGPLPK